MVFLIWFVAYLLLLVVFDFQFIFIFWFDRLFGIFGCYCALIAWSVFIHLIPIIFFSVRRIVNKNNNNNNDEELRDNNNMKTPWNTKKKKNNKSSIGCLTHHMVCYSGYFICLVAPRMNTQIFQAKQWITFSVFFLLLLHRFFFFI